MARVILLIFAFLMNAYTFAWADNVQQVITLKDGSQIKGALSAIENGVYTVKTPIIGDVHINASDVASITNDNGNAATLPAAQPLAGPTTPPTGLNQQVTSMQQQLMSNPQSMALLQQMAQDPQMAQALQDPALVQAVMNHDYKAVQNSPAVQKLLAEPQMQALLQKLAAQQGSTSQ